MAIFAGCGGEGAVHGGGGGGGGGEVKTAFEQLLEWAGGTEATVYRFEHDATEFRPHLPPVSETELDNISRSGAVDGVSAELAVDGMTRGTNLDSEEGKNLTCFLLTKAANGELSLEPEALEQLVIGYIEDRVVETIPQAQFRAGVNGFIEAVFEAESEGEAAINSALATACA
ncbi:MAG TPA: hypothetical protein VLL27_03480 [Solirubrobacterales bacterium]|nr:hypothetical protein [Solirubrobacterales bacterium]